MLGPVTFSRNDEEWCFTQSQWFLTVYEEIFIAEYPRGDDAILNSIPNIKDGVEDKDDDYKQCDIAVSTLLEWVERPLVRVRVSLLWGRRKFHYCDLSARFQKPCILRRLGWRSDRLVAPMGFAYSNLLNRVSKTESKQGHSRTDFWSLVQRTSWLLRSSIAQRETFLPSVVICSKDLIG